MGSSFLEKGRNQFPICQISSDSTAYSMALLKQRWPGWWSAKAKGRHSVLKPGPGAGKQDKGSCGLLFFKNTLKTTCPKSDLCIFTNRSQKALGYLEIIRLKFDNVESAFPSIC